ncbi:4-hydroxy-tetrahydrodipicolinate synthase [soil metagenome]
MPVFQGVGVALVTLFDEQLSVDLDATVALAEEVVDVGVSAVLVAGTTGEAATLDSAERVSLISAVREALPADVPVIAGTGAPSGRQAATLTRMAADAGADAALVLTPPRTADPRRYFDDVRTAAGEMPLLAYHFPAVSPPGITVAQLRDLPVVGLKDSTGDPNRLLELLTTYDGEVYVGSSALLTQAALLGATGAILALANAHPEDCVAAMAGDAEAQLRLAPHHRGMSPFPGIKSQVAQRYGCATHARVG